MLDGTEIFDSASEWLRPERRSKTGGADRREHIFDV